MAEEKKVRYSRKRERIYEWILSRDDHPSAEEIYLALRPEFPDLSLGTVYKNLHFLEDHGRISRVLSPQGVEHYDWRTEGHGHFICRSCGMIRDLEIPDETRACLPRTSADGGRSETCTMTAFGLCPQCLSGQEHVQE